MHTANFVYQPSIFSASSLDDDQKKYILNMLEEEKLSQLNSWLSIPFSNESKKNLNDFLKNLDNIRNIDSKIFDNKKPKLLSGF